MQVPGLALSQGMDSLIRPKPEEITQTSHRSFYLPHYVICSTLMDLTMSDYYYVCSGELSSESCFEHREECFAFLEYLSGFLVHRLVKRKGHNMTYRIH
jgi:hypothetical protein